MVLYCTIRRVMKLDKIITFRQKNYLLIVLPKAVRNLER